MLDDPVVILESGPKPLDKPEWDSTEEWLRTLSEFGSAALGLILPLELPGRYGRRGELWGIELLRWLRWSAPGSIRLAPVLTVAWQPIEMILRAKHEPLLISPGTWFSRLPDILEGSPSLQERFITQVRISPDRFKVRLADLELLAAGTAGEAARLTHHDLANEGYSAWRLWAGYLQALRQVSEGAENRKAIKGTLAWAERVQFPWMSDLEKRRHQPAFRQFQVLRRSTTPPRYPEVEDSSHLLRVHAKEGLPPVVRVLVVDDEFDQGLADVLLRMLFGNVEFTTKGPGDQEWVYSQTSPAGQSVKLACVKNAKAGIHWLARWGDIKLTGRHVAGADDESLENWLDAWAHPTLQLDNLDQRLTRDAKPVTVVLLDLRLSREEPEASYSPDDFESLRFRNAVKEERPDLPVVILTASRQALNYVAAMAGAGPQDGWLIKEAPDVPVDDNNSANAVQYLLSRLRLFSTLGQWYRAELGWRPKQIAECCEFWLRSDLTQLLQQAQNLATEIVQDAVANRAAVESGVRFHGYITSRISNRPHRFLARLVGRMVAMACLLRSANWSTTGEPSWSLTDFQTLLPLDPDSKSQDEKVFSSTVSIIFNRDLFLPGVKSAINALLPVEYEWLLKQDWGDVADPCTKFLTRYLDGAASGR